jgi:hypothetical protein
MLTNVHLGYFNNDVASGSFQDLDFAKRGEHPSFDNMTPAEKAASFEIMAAATSEPLMFRHMRPIYRAQTRKAFFDEHAAKEVLPHLELVYIYCTRSHWSCAWGLVELKREIKEEADQGRIGRSIRFTDIPGANHLVSCLSSIYSGNINKKYVTRFTGTIPRPFGQQLLILSTVRSCYRSSGFASSTYTFAERAMDVYR